MMQRISPPSRLLHPAKACWPTPVIPQKCRKCGRYRIPTTNMAGGLRFSTTGRVFSPRGLNFVKSDGTCIPCDCDNPPGSGRNFGRCVNCPDGIGPASVLLSFIDVDVASCFRGGVLDRVEFDPLAIYFRYTQRPLSDYCVPITGCGGIVAGSTGSAYSSLFSASPDFACADGLYPTGNEVPRQNVLPQTVPTWLSTISVGYGLLADSSLGWQVTTRGGDQEFGPMAVFYGEGSSPDCSTQIVIPNATVGGFGGFTDPIGATIGTGGHVILTPLFSLC